MAESTCPAMLQDELTFRKTWLGSIAFYNLLLRRAHTNPVFLPRCLRYAMRLPRRPQLMQCRYRQDAVDHIPSSLKLGAGTFDEPLVHAAVQLQKSTFTTSATGGRNLKMLLLIAVPIPTRGSHQEYCYLAHQLLSCKAIQP